MTTVAINTYEQNLNAIIESEADANIEMLTKVQAEGGNIAQAMLEMNARQAQDAKAKTEADAKSAKDAAEALDKARNEFAKTIVKPELDKAWLAGKFGVRFEEMCEADEGISRFTYTIEVNRSYEEIVVTPAVEAREAKPKSKENPDGVDAVEAQDAVTERKLVNVSLAPSLATCNTFVNRGVTKSAGNGSGAGKGKPVITFVRMPNGTVKEYRSASAARKEILPDNKSSLGRADVIKAINDLEGYTVVDSKS